MRNAALSWAHPVVIYLGFGLLWPLCSPGPAARATEPSTPESVIRTVVQANADKDLRTMSRWMAHDEDRAKAARGQQAF